MLLQAFAHTSIGAPVAVFCASMEKPQQFEALGVFGIASSAAVEQVQAKELAMILGCPLEDNRRSQYTVDWRVFEFVEAGVYLWGKKNSNSQFEI